MNKHIMTNSASLELDSRRLLAEVARGEATVEGVLYDLTEEQLTRILSSVFERTGTEQSVGTGKGILPGDVSAQLVLDRGLGERLLEEARARGTEIDLIYSVPSGNLGDFEVLKGSKGFFTSDPAETAFCAVQASCEGIPAVVGVDCLYEDPEGHDDLKVLTYEFRDGSTLDVEKPERRISFFVCEEKIELAESEFVSLSGGAGQIFRGSLVTSYATDILPAYQLLSKCYLEALARFGPGGAEARLVDTAAYQENQEWLVGVVGSEEFKGFEKLVQGAGKVADLKTFSTAHTPKTVALTRMFASSVGLRSDGQVNVVAANTSYGVGLLRDERMWNEPADIDLMRLVLLGPDVVGDEYPVFEKRYREVFSEMLYRVMKVGTGEAVVVRLLCMPFSMIFAEDFEPGPFADTYGLDAKAIRERVRVLGSESEAYHGCRGVRVTVQREDICELWCESVILAAMKARDEGAQVNLRVLLSLW